MNQMNPSKARFIGGIIANLCKFFQSAGLEKEDLLALVENFYENLPMMRDLYQLVTMLKVENINIEHAKAAFDDCWDTVQKLRQQEKEKIQC
jgi:hypothetical protein